MRISASARIRSQAGPNSGWPRSTVRISTPSTWSIARAQDLRLDRLDAAAVGAKALVADDQRQRDRVEAEDQRPFLGDDVEQSVDAVGLDRGEHRRVDRGDRARMAAGEGDQVLVGLLGRAEPLAQVRDRPLFERDHRGHGARGYARERLISYHNACSRRSSTQTKGGGAFRHRRPDFSA